MQERHNSIANALELCLSCTYPFIYKVEHLIITVWSCACSNSTKVIYRDNTNFKVTINTSNFLWQNNDLKWTVLSLFLMHCRCCIQTPIHRYIFLVLGHYCPAGSSEAIRCVGGTYQDEQGQWECKTCPSGYFCDNTLDPVVLFNSSLCPAGEWEEWPWTVEWPWT